MKQLSRNEYLRVLAIYSPVIIVLIQILFDSDTLSLFPGIPRFGIFKDLSIVFDNASSCPIPLNELYKNDCHINPTNIPLFLIAVARFFGLGQSDLFAFGLILDVATILLFSTISRLLIAGWSSVVFVWACFLSFPFQLALERANSDLLMLDLVILSVLIFGISNKVAAFAISITTLNIALLSKIYPIVCIPVIVLKLLFSNLSLISKRIVFLFSLLVTSISSILTLPALTHTKNSLVDYSGGITYGLLVSPHPDENIFILLLIKSIFTIFSFFLSFKIFYSATAKATITSSGSSFLITSLLGWFASSIFLASYFLFVSVSYRLIFLSLVIPFIFKIKNYFHSSQTNLLSDQNLIFLLFILLALCAGYSGYIQPASSDSKQELDLFINVITIPSLIGFSMAVFIANVYATILPNKK